MAAIRGRNTRPEMIVRQALHAKGFRYRLQNRKLPGCPDLTLKKYNAVIFVHGCFWHGHACQLFRLPTTRQDFWRAKITSNVVRDIKTAGDLRSQGWRVGEVWECSLKAPDRKSSDSIACELSHWLESEQSTCVIAAEDVGGQRNLAVCPTNNQTGRFLQ